MARTKILLTWDASNPSLTVNAQQKHFASPRKLSRHELDDCREKYGFNASLGLWLTLVDIRKHLQAGANRIWANK